MKVIPKSVPILKFIFECPGAERSLTKKHLTWSTRMRIAIGSAQGIAYMHHDCVPGVIHRGIKSSNVLLDNNMEPHVSDFGLAKLVEDDSSHVTTIVAGTFGYLAPGKVSVFSFQYRDFEKINVSRLCKYTLFVSISTV